MSYTKFSRWLDDVQDEEAGFYDDGGDDVASYLLNLTNLDHVVDRADAAERLLVAGALRVVEPLEELGSHQGVGACGSSSQETFCLPNVPLH